MSKIEHPDNHYTQQVKQLIELVYPKEAGRGSVCEDARHYYILTPDLEDHINELQGKLKAVANPDKQPAVVEQLTKKLKSAQAKLESERLERLERLQSVAHRLLALCEGDTYEETQLLSAKFLGTVMLLTRGPEGKFAQLHQRLKPLYKAVLALRLSDKALEHDYISHPYLTARKAALTRFKGNRAWQERWQNEVAMPIIWCALLQDIGLQSYEARAILHGPDNNLDEFRVLENDQRKQLLKINFSSTLNYLKNGLGLPAYVGNDKAERDAFIASHTATMEFMQALMKDAFISKSGLGEILKIPQIYVSVVLSTKPDYSRKSLPKGYLLIEQLAKKGALHNKLAEAFIGIVGYFPLGFGITYIPQTERGFDREGYECAIVTRLNPEHPAEPICRPVTRNLTYIRSGSDETVGRNVNLFFPANRKKLMKMGEDRLKEIMSQLSGNFTPDAIDDLIPSFWEPADYFAYKNNQNLWNRGR
ncbi:hypothetical protein OCL06_15330 [Alteromonas sp. ASW11-19]|uniref:Uncharacterized protein n=1 Tax=Alteromonas salexigens TaxID=2982530 RepID=A0ABT2VRM3_9ALTE|nr:hypothetical protein [Alteromonas salexigens]MCU7555961.1 hypothetical protein [Alteromonas salexigens]